MIHRSTLLPIAISALLGLTACGSAEDELLHISLIDNPDALATPFDARPGTVRQEVLPAVAQGLVTYDIQGDLVPGLAARWIVTDDGLSFIFRLSDVRWPDDDRPADEGPQADDVARALTRQLERARKGRLAPELAAVRDIRAMTGGVIEIRLTAPQPNLLHVLAQPEFAITIDGKGPGPMRLFYRDGLGLLSLAAPPSDTVDEDDPEDVMANALAIRSEPALKAVARFATGNANLVLGGRFQDLPLIDAAKIQRSALRIDPAPGLFGLQFVENDGFLADAGNREAISMAIDRGAALAALNIDGWTVTNRFVPPGVREGSPPTERWADMDMAARREAAAQRVLAWRSANGEIAPLRIALPAGPGSTLLFYALRADLGRVGLDATQVAHRADADLRLLDDVAVTADAGWYLDNLSCLRQRICSEEAEFQLEDARNFFSFELRDAKWTAAEALMEHYNSFIPIGVPIRWSLASPALEGFATNPRARHPLEAIAPRPN